MIHQPEKWILRARIGIHECTPQELRYLDEQFGESITGSRWWRLLDESYTGAKYSNLHLFFYSSETAQKPCAGFSAQHFLAVPLLPHMPSVHPLLSIVDPFKLIQPKVSCLLIHSLSSHQSLSYEEKDERAFALAFDAALKQLRHTLKIHIILVRSLPMSHKRSLSSHLPQARWSFVDGYPTNVVDLRATDFADYLAQFRSHRRQRLKASMRKLKDRPQLRIQRICTSEQLEPYLSQISQLKAETAKRNEGEFLFPIMEKPTYFTGCLRSYGDDHFCFVLLDGDQLLGYFLAVAHRKKARGLSFGIRLPEARNCDGWYNLSLTMFAALIKAGVTSINMGNGNDAIKGKVGARQVATYSALSFYPWPLRLFANRYILPKLQRF